MSSISESVVSTLQETQAMTVHFNDLPESDPLKKLIHELYATEVKILVQYMKVYGTNLSGLNLQFIPEDGVWQVLMQEFNRELQAQQVSTAGRGLSILQRYRSLLMASPYTDMWLSALKLVLTLGETSILVRWYLVRDNVLGLVRQREIYRSRLMLHQLSVMVGQVKSQEKLVHQLRDENHALRHALAQIEDHMRSVAEENGQIRRALLRQVDGDETSRDVPN